MALVQKLRRWRQSVKPRVGPSVTAWGWTTCMGLNNLHGAEQPGKRALVMGETLYVKTYKLSAIYGCSCFWLLLLVNWVTGKNVPLDSPTETKTETQLRHLRGWGVTISHLLPCTTPNSLFFPTPRSAWRVRSQLQAGYLPIDDSHLSVKSIVQRRPGIFLNCNLHFKLHLVQTHTNTNTMETKVSWNHNSPHCNILWYFLFSLMKISPILFFNDTTQDSPYGIHNPIMVPTHY